MGPRATERQNSLGKKGSDLALPPEPDPYVHNPMGVPMGLSRWVTTEISSGQGRAFTYFSQNTASEAVPVTNLPKSDLKIPRKPKYHW